MNTLSPSQPEFESRIPLNPGHIGRSGGYMKDLAETRLLPSDGDPNSAMSRHVAAAVLAAEQTDIPYITQARPNEIHQTPTVTVPGNLYISASRSRGVGGRHRR